MTYSLTSYVTILSGTLFDIDFDILPGILSGTLPDIYSILAWLLLVLHMICIDTDMVWVIRGLPSK